MLHIGINGDRMKLNKLAEEIFKNAVKKGFWSKKISTKVIPEKLALVHSEISEVLEEYRNGHSPTEIYIKEGKPEGIPIEIADAVIRLLDICAAYDINIENAIKIKMDFNKRRPYKHGKKI